MNINNQNLSMYQNTNFQGVLDKSVTKRIKLLEKEAIERKINFAINEGRVIKREDIEKIKITSKNIITKLQDIAKNLLKNSIMKMDGKQLIVKNKKWGITCTNLIGRHEAYHADVKVGKFNSYIRTHRDEGNGSYKQLDYIMGILEDLYLTEKIVNDLEADTINTTTSMKKKKEVLDLIRYRSKVGPIRQLLIDHKVKVIDDEYLESYGYKSDILETVANKLADNNQKELNKKQLISDNYKVLDSIDKN